MSANPAMSIEMMDEIYQNAVEYWIAWNYQTPLDEYIDDEEDEDLDENNNVYANKIDAQVSGAIPIVRFVE